MRVPSKVAGVIGIVAVVALTASAADARHVDRNANTTRFGGAYNSVAPAAPNGGVSYDAEGAPFPTGHGSGTNSPDFQLVR